MNKKIEIRHALVLAAMLAAFIFGGTLVAYEALTVDVSVTGSSDGRAEVGIFLPDGKSFFVDDINNSSLFRQVAVWELDDVYVEIDGPTASGWVDVTIQGWNWGGDFAYSMEEYTATVPLLLPLNRMDNNTSFRITWGEPSTNTGIPAGMAAVSVVGEFADAELISPEGKKTSLMGEGPILVPVDEVERHVVHFMGDKEWANIVATSFDGETRYVYALEDGSEWIFRAGNTAITSYHWD